ncbi:YqhG family protein [Cohnella sp. REN36]|uniref:YqhG family protein n=1 Tax=Cohnella sp. REN36 TaxID=2887347 RepID=UPI001D158D47|nr:YqhG family protein [Cohnella sp. REN36]MCC3374336.1 YqhG family protein [Cohnella sp. REN36]
MNAKQVQKFVLSYLEATQCQMMEKSPNHVTVKLSPEADRQLTNRPYYWSFVDRTGAEPETMTFSWQFAPAEASEATRPQSGGTGASVYGSVAGGAPPPAPLFAQPGPRIIREDVYFGSSRLAQIFDSVRLGGRCITLFEEPPRGRLDPLRSNPYTAWLGANFKVGYECDMKREELYGWGISLATGVIDERFFEKLRERRLTAKLPSNVHLLRNGLSLRKGMTQLEHALERKLKGTDFGWAVEANERRKDEMKRIEAYYEPMISRAANEEQAEALRGRFRQREAEIDWQYRPRVTISVMNCGIFHLPGID